MAAAVTGDYGPTLLPAVSPATDSPPQFPHMDGGARGLEADPRREVRLADRSRRPSSMWRAATALSPSPLQHRSLDGRLREPLKEDPDTRRAGACAGLAASGRIGLASTTALPPSSISHQFFRGRVPEDAVEGACGVHGITFGLDIGASSMPAIHAARSDRNLQEMLFLSPFLFS